MRFMATGEWRKEGMMRLVLAFFLVFAVMLWVSNLLMFLAHLSFDPAKIAEHYLGVETEFAPAVKRPYEVMLQVTHGHILAIGLMLLTLTHMVIFVPGRASWKIPLVCLTFLSAMANEASGWLIRYHGAGWAKAKIAMFGLFQICLAVVILLLLLTIIRGLRGSNGNGQQQRRMAEAAPPYPVTSPSHPNEDPPPADQGPSHPSEDLLPADQGPSHPDRKPSP